MRKLRRKLQSVAFIVLFLLFSSPVFAAAADACSAASFFDQLVQLLNTALITAEHVLSIPPG